MSRWVGQTSAALDEGRVRGLGALNALTGRRPRRWPWAVAAAATGALAGAAVVLAVRTLGGRDAPDAVPPEQLRAVVDPLPVAPDAGRPSS
jgi:hypothetical protein